MRVMVAQSLRSLFLFLFWSVTFVSNAQQNLHFKLKGTVLSGNKEPLEFAITKLLSLPDSAEKAAGITLKDGTFQLLVPDAGAYLVKISFVGYATLFKRVLVVKDKPILDLGTIELAEGINLSAVTVSQTVIPLVLKGDTLEYSGLAFKTAPNANVENLLRKIAGFEIDDRGNVKINGEALNRVTVEGKKFFGGNYRIATQNLPADAIAKIQVIDDKTEKAKATGIDDGKREKVVNLILKEDKKGGWFGSGSLAGGSRERYLASGNLNHFTPKIQVNMLAMSNNTNQSYSVGEVGGYGGYDPGPGAISGMINGVAYGRTGQGLATTNSGAVNFSTSWGKNNRNTFNMSYILGSVSSMVQTEANTQTFQPNGVFFSTNSNTNVAENQQHTYEFYFQNKLDTLTTLTIAPNLSYTRMNGMGTRLTAISNESFSRINSSTQHLMNKFSTPSMGGALTLSRRLAQKKGSFALTLSSTYTGGSGKSTNINDAIYYDDNGMITTEEIDQIQGMENTNHVLSGKVFFNRQLTKEKKTSIIFNLGAEKTARNSDQTTYDYNPLTGRYETVVPVLTSDYYNVTYQQEAEAGINRSKNKVILTGYAVLQHVNLQGNVSGGLSGGINRNYWILSPRFMLSYRASNRRSLSLNLNTQVTPPSIVNLQPVQNNNNPLYIREGNPNLKPAVSYIGSLRFSVSQLTSGFYQHYNLDFSFSESAFSTSNLFDDQTGVTYSHPVNVKGNYFLSFIGNFGGKFKVEGLGYSFGLSASTRRFFNFINDQQNATHSISAGGSSSVFYAYKDLIYLSASNRTTYIDARNKLAQAGGRKYFSLFNSASVNIKAIHRWRITSELNNQMLTHQQAGGDQNILIVNAGVQRFLMPKDQLILELKGYDLFDQNANFTRTITDNRIEDLRVMNMRRYLMLKLTYKVNKMGKK